MHLFLLGLLLIGDSLLFYFFSGKKIENKIEFIENNYFDINYNLWIPLAFAVFYVLILPYVMALFDWLSQKGIAIRKLISKNNRISDIQYKQEIAAEEWQLEKIKEGSPDIQGMKERISILELQLEEKNEVISDLSKNIDVSKEDTVTKEKSDKPVEKRKPTKRRSTTKRNQKSKSTNDNDNTNSSKKFDSKDFPVMKDIVIRDLAKTEREWMLIYSLYSSDFGSNVFTREDIWNKYGESNRKTESRRKNITNNIRTMVKANQINFINDDEMLLTTQGKEVALEILNR